MNQCKRPRLNNEGRRIMPVPVPVPVSASEAFLVRLYYLMVPVGDVAWRSEGKVLCSLLAWTRLPEHTRNSAPGGEYSSN